MGMIERTEDGLKCLRVDDTPALNGEGDRPETANVLDEYDASTMVGLRTIVCGAAIEHVGSDGEVAMEIPKLQELLAAVAVTRCLIPIKLRGAELKAIRHIMKLTMSDLAKRLDDRTATETVSRWESEAQSMGGYAEKIVRLVVCEELCAKAPGVTYNAAMIANLRVVDPWRVDPEYVVPYIVIKMVRVKEFSGTLIDAWDAKIAA
jgi:DNA-binding transcriptional regulator YiaG